MVNLARALLPLAVLVPQGASAAEPDCRDALMPAPGVLIRNVSPLDIARLRDFGRQESSLAGEAPFSVSPDGRLAALVLRRGDPAHDSYCIGVVVVPIDGSGEPRLVDLGGEFIHNTSDVRGIPDLPIGNARPVTPLWSPDGRWLAYLRRDNGLTRAWRARADGALAEAVSKFGTDIQALRWSEDGSSIIVRTRPGLAAGEAEIEIEERTGFLYDRRFWTLSRARPRPPLPLEEIEQRIDPADGRVIATVSGPAPAAGRPPEALAYARSPHGDRAWVAPDDSAVIMGPASLRVEVDGRTIRCHSAYCSQGVGALWWVAGGELVFLQGGSPENGGTTSLLRWRPDQEADPALVLATTDALMGCRPARSAIVCARERPTQPRHLVRIDPATGEARVLYDPNPELANRRMGQVERLTWRDGDGVPAYGDLLIPPGRRPGMRHPLVVVQYHSRGFLRGGTGDEYPIHALAARGFAVLSVERPRLFAEGKARDLAEFVRLNATDFAERCRVLASLEAGIAAAIERGAVDPERIGITGVSDGAAGVQFALINSRLFRAAAVSSCCDEPSSSMFAAGPAYAELLQAAGFPGPGEDGEAFWGRYSLAANAAWLRTPILMQLTDDEFRLGLETYVTLEHHRVPVEMYVFADSYHQKWRPAQRLASYERAIDWFDFWLNGKVDEAPAKEAQYARWRALAERRD